MNQTKLHNIVMISGIVASGLITIITALTSSGLVATGGAVTTILQILLFLAHVGGGNTPSNTSGTTI